MNSDPSQIPGLDRLHDIILPPAVSWWPLSAGAWLLIAALVAWLIAGVLVRWRRYRADAYRRAALRRLDELRPALLSAETRGQALEQVAELLKRTALAAFPRNQVASLTGEAWLQFLATTAGDGELNSGAGRGLVTSVYDPRAVARISRADCEGILRLTRNWIAKHRPERAVPSPQAPKAPSPRQ